MIDPTLEFKIICKKLFKLTLARLLFYSGFLPFYIKTRRILGIDDEILILRYHRIFNDDNREKFYKLGINKSNFKQQIRYLKRKYNFLSIEDVACALKNGAEILPNSIAVTFDDGYKDNQLNAYPVLEGYKIPATIYLTTGYIGTSRLLPWDRLRYIVTHSKLPRIRIALLDSKTFDLSTLKQRKKSFYRLLDCLKKVDDKLKNRIINELEERLIDFYPDESKNDRLMSWAKAGKMSKNGISFGGHTLTHPLLTRVSLKKAELEIKECKKEIEKRLHTKVTSFAYPGGDINEEIKIIVRKSGYETACTTFPGINNKNSDLYAIKRKGISDGNSTGLTGKFSKALFAVEISGLFDQLFMRVQK